MDAKYENSGCSPPHHFVGANTLSEGELSLCSRKRKVFVVSDFPIVIEGLTYVIEREPDLEVCRAVEKGRSFVQTMTGLKPDIVVMDLFVEGKIGFELVEEIASKPSRPPVLVISVHEGAAYVEHALRAGARGYALKQEPTCNVMKAIRQVLNGKAYLSEGVSTTLVEKFIDGLGGDKRTAGVGKLSSRELVVLRHIGEGMTTRQIADKLCVSAKTVETYHGRLKIKLKIRTHSDLLQYAIRWSRGLSRA